MKRYLVIAARSPPAVGAPAFAQMEVTCGDYTLMDNAKQMETIAALEVRDQPDGRRSRT